MKDSKDKQTPDLFKNPIGRPRKFITNAERQKAYRKRKLTQRD